jgi:hypothetical protein
MRGQFRDGKQIIMIRLAAVFCALIASTLSGVAVVIALVAGYGTIWPLVLAAVAGALIALPVAVFVAWRLNK